MPLSAPWAALETQDIREHSRTSAMEWLPLPFCSDIKRHIAEFAWIDGSCTVQLWEEALQQKDLNHCIHFALRNGCIPIVDYSLRNGRDQYNLEVLLRSASTHGHLTMCKWIHCMTLALTHCAGESIWKSRLLCAANAGRLNVVTWMLEMSNVPPDRALAIAACNGDLSMLRGLKQLGASDFDMNVVSAAKDYGRMDALLWLEEQGANTYWDLT